MMKLEGGGQELVIEFRVDQEIVYELIFDDEFLDLEEGEFGGILSRIIQIRLGGEVKKELELFSFEFFILESQWCFFFLGLNVELIRVFFYEDVFSEEDNELMFEDIFFDSDYCKGRVIFL